MRWKACTLLLIVGHRLWPILPARVKQARIGIAAGRMLQRFVRDRAPRYQSCATLFVRNRPMLAYAAALAAAAPEGTKYRVLVAGCSTGPEAYSMAWELASARAPCDLEIVAFDISQEAVGTARTGVYSLDDPDELTKLMSAEEVETLFVRRDGELVVRDEFRLVDFRVADARDPHLPALLGRFDLVMANRFLCHMTPMEASSCLRRLARLVEPGGYLCASGVDLSVRSHTLPRLGFVPVEDRLREVHDGEITLLSPWPFEYWALEPYDRSRPDRVLRYATFYRRPPSTTGRPPASMSRHRRRRTVGPHRNADSPDSARRSPPDRPAVRPQPS